MKEQNNINGGMVSPSNYYGASGQPAEPKSKKIFLVVSAIIVALAILAAIIIVTIMNSDLDEPALIEAREDTPTLQLYAGLEEEMTLEALKEAVSNANNNAEIFIEDGGFGSITIPDSKDAVFFYIDKEEEQTEEEEEVIINDEETTTNTIDSYQPTDIVYNIRYAHELTDDMNMGIDYNEEDNVYEVSVNIEAFSFSTKEEAIKAYLAPEVNQ